MDKERLKLIVRNLKSLVDAYRYETYQSQISDYDEVFDDDDGYPD